MHGTRRWMTRERDKLSRWHGKTRNVPLTCRQNVVAWEDTRKKKEKRHPSDVRSKFRCVLSYSISPSRKPWIMRPIVPERCDRYEPVAQFHTVWNDFTCISTRAIYLRSTRVTLFRAILTTLNIHQLNSHIPTIFYNMKLCYLDQIALICRRWRTRRNDRDTFFNS